MGKNKLDVAPKSDQDVRYPEWGRVAGVTNDRVYRDVSTMPSPTTTAPTSMPKTAQNLAESNRTAPNVFATSTNDMMTNHNNKSKVSTESIVAFFKQNSIRYEVIPGDHTMIRLLEPIYFKPDSLHMTDKSRDFLENVARYIADYQGIEMVVEGHTDNLGDPAYNEALSKKRADAVKDWISSRFIHLDSIYTRGYGSAMPTCENKTPSGRACNRRVEVFFILPS
jgi:outer membrane protein OmpA-like peptidoglycan-associated protein